MAKQLLYYFKILQSFFLFFYIYFTLHLMILYIFYKVFIALLCVHTQVDVIEEDESYVKFKNKNKWKGLLPCADHGARCCPFKQYVCSFPPHFYVLR